MRARVYQFGDWRVDMDACAISRGDEGPLKVEPRAMDVLGTLCAHAGEVLSADALLRLCWDGVVVGDNQVHKAIAQLRRSLGDDASEARYIENIRKRGYRTVAPVTPLAGGGEPLGEEWSRGSPFVGLDAFDEAHAGVFFGRDGAIAALRDTVLARAASGHGLTLVLGASGSGKTSLVQAGVVPALRQPGQAVRVIATTHLDLGDVGDDGGDDGRAATALPLPVAVGGALVDLELDGVPLLAGHSAQGLAEHLTRPLDDAALAGLFPAVTAAGADARVLLVIDRLEAAFHTPDGPAGGASEREAAVQRFFTMLDTLARSQAVLVIATCRNDFYPDIAKQPVLMAAKAGGGHFDLSPPSRADIMQMIRRPAQVAGLGFATDPATGAALDDVLCDDTADNPDALPLLQYTLQELYLRRSPSRELTMDAYRELGGIEGAIGKRAEATLDSLPEAARQSLPAVLSLVVTVSGGDGAIRSQRIPWAALANPAERALVDTLVRQRLFVTQVFDGEPVFGVAHEALLRQWPRALAWIAQHRQALDLRGRLEDAARRWEEEGRRGDLLLPRGKRLEEARELLATPRVPLAGGAAAFITASIRRERRAEWRRRATLAGVMMVALVAVLLGVRANRAEGVAEMRRHQAEDLMNFMVGDFADKLRPLGRLDLLADIGRKALSYFGDEPLADLTPESREQQARALQTIAEVARARADPTAGRDALRRAKRLLDANLADGHVTMRMLKDLGADAFWLGQLSLDQGDLDGAQAAFKQYEGYAQRMVDRDRADVDAWIELSYARNNLGSVASARGDTPAAIGYFQSSLDLKRQALRQHPDDHNLQADLADTLSWLASARESEGQLRNALDLSGQEEEIVRTLRAAIPSEYTWTYRLVTAISWRVRLLTDLGEQRQAEDEARQGQALAQTLVGHDPSNRIWRLAQLQLDIMVDELWEQDHDPAQILALQRATGQGIAELLGQSPGNAGVRAVQDINLIAMGKTLVRLGRAREAVGSFQQALADLNDDKRPSTNEEQHVSTVDSALIGLAAAERMIGDAATATSRCRDAINLTKPYIEKHSTDYYTHKEWVEAHYCIGEKNSASTSQQWLAKIGYRNATYLRSISE